MHLSDIVLALCVSLSIPSSLGIVLSYDEAYNVSSTSLNTVACSDGPNGLIEQGYTTFGSIPNHPSIGGSYTVEGWNSPKCGACYKLAYTKAKTTNVIYMTAVDHTEVGFNIASSAFLSLVGSQAVGKVDVVAQEVDKSFCGFK